LHDYFLPANLIVLPALDLVMRPISRRPSIHLLTLAAALTSFAVRSADAQRGQTTIVAFRNDLPQSERTINAPPGQVVEAVKMVYAQVGLPLLQSSSNAQDLFTPYLQVRGQLFGRSNSAFFACQETDIAGGNLADRGLLTFAVLMRARPQGNATVLQTQVDARVSRRDVAANSVECASTGVLEKALIDMVDQLVRDTAPPPAP
jgi:hypothetical protein